MALANLGVFHFNNALTNYSDEELRRKELRVAQLMYRRALSREPDYVMVHEYLADLYSLADFDRPALAAFHLGRTLELDPQRADADQLRDRLKAAEAAAAQRRLQRDERADTESTDQPEPAPPSTITTPSEVPAEVPATD